MTGLRNAGALAVCLLLAGCTSATTPADTTADAATLDGFQDAWETNFNSGNAAGLAALYHDDAIVSPPGSPPLRSHAALQEYFTKDMAANAGVVFDIAPPTDRAISGDIAWETGTWTAKDQSGATLDTGKYLTAYRKRDGTWLMSADMWNSDRAPAPAPAETPAGP